LPHTGFLARFIHKSDAREGKQCLSAIIGGKKLGNKGFTLYICSIILLRILEKSKPSDIFPVSREAFWRSGASNEQKEIKASNI
jgi:hypothetical protein